MYRNLLILPDGTELFSGVTGQAAIQSATITQCVNSGQELTPGSVCAGMLEVTVLTPAAFSLEAGQEVTLYKVLSTGQRIKQGLYTLEKPVRQSAGIYKLTAYDRVSWLDKDLTGWLAGLTGWPYALYDLAQLVCEECGVTLAGDQIPNGSYLVQRFSAEGITGRQIMQWIGQVACRFCRATEDGALEFAWYAPVRQHRICPSDAQNITVTYDDAGDVAMTSGGLTVRYDQGSLTLDSPSLAAVCNGEDLALSTQTVLPYYQNGLQFSDYTTAPIEKVQIRLTGEDVGAVWPDNAASANTYILSGNYLLTTGTAETLEPVAKSIFETLQGVTYTPCRVEIPAELDIRAGDIVTVTDSNGKTITMYVMTKTQAGQRDTLECTGSPSRDSSAAANEQSYQALSGKVLELHADVEGLRAENRDAAGNLASLALTVDGIQTKAAQQADAVEGLRQQVSTVEQTAQAVKISVEKLENDGASKVKTAMGYTFDDTGLRITRDGQQMENRLDNTGMYVERAGQTILQASSSGVVAVDVQVRNYLCIGDHARLEDYTDGTDNKRTACFFTAGSA